MNPQRLGVTMAVTLAALLAACATGPDSVADAKRINADRSVAVGKPAATFLVEMVDARLMDIAESRLALERSSTPAIRDYAARMVTDQTLLLAQLRALAIDGGVELPSTIGADKRSGLKSLAEAPSTKFDQHYIRSIRIDHERDVAAFGNARDLPDPAIARFASRELPLIQSHLDGIERIDKEY